MNVQYTFPLIRKTCHKMAHLSQIAYKDNKEAKPLFKARGYGKHKFFSNNGSQAHAVWDDNEIVIAFRGTEPDEFADLKADLNLWPDRAESGGWVHNGFQNALDEIWNKIFLLIEAHDDKQLIFTGHSLGGAMATVAASRCKHLDPKLYTFGSPRVGNADFVNSFKNVKHYRFVNNNDIVPTVPMWWMGYAHHGTCMYIDYTGCVRNFTPWQKFIDKMKGRWRALVKSQAFDGLYDHSCDYYCLYTSEHTHDQGTH